MRMSQEGEGRDKQNTFSWGEQVKKLMWPLKHDFLTVERIFKHLEDPRKNKKAFCLLSSFPTWLKQDQGITCPKTKTKKESSSVTSKSHFIKQ